MPPFPKSIMRLSLCLPALCLSPAFAREAQHSAALCAYQAQQAVARRHGLSFKGDGSSSSRIYADPEMSREADDAFDACIRKRAACEAARVKPRRNICP